ncbi:hypothetical protein JCM3770_003937 [Rhodotorula araucariae]
MNGSVGPDANSIHEIVDLTGDPPDIPDRRSSAAAAAHRTPSDTRCLPPEVGSGFSAYERPNEHPAFPAAVPSPPTRAGYTALNIASQYSQSPHNGGINSCQQQSLASRDFTYAATRPPPQYARPPYPSPRERFPQKQHNYHQQSASDHTVHSSLLVRGTTTVTHGAYPNFQHRHAPAIAPSASSSSLPYSTPGAYAPGRPRAPSHPQPHHQQQYHQTSHPSQHLQHRQQNSPPAQQQPAQPPARAAEDYDPPPRARVLPPGFSHTFEPAGHPQQQIRPVNDAVDLTRNSPFEPLHHEDDMRGPPTRIVPMDPEARHSRPADVAARAGGGWDNGFNDDDDDDANGGSAPADSPAGRRRGAAGKAKATFSGAAATKGKGKGKGKAKEMGMAHPGGEREAIAKLSFKKTVAQSTVDAANFHAPVGLAGNAAAGPSRPRAIPQDDPATAQEMAGAVRKKQVAATVGAKRNANGSGAGKGKMPEVLELSDDDDDDDDDEIEDADGESGSGSGSSARARGAPLHLLIKDTAVAAHAPPHHASSSDDELAIRSDRRTQLRDRERRASALAEKNIPGGLVRQKTAAYEAMATTKTPVVRGMKGKTKPCPDGGPTDGGEYDEPPLPPPPTGKIPRASMTEVARGKAKQKGKPDSATAALGEFVKTIEVKPYMLSRDAIPEPDRASKFTLILNTRGNPKNHKLTLCTRALETDEDAEEYEIKEKLVHQIEYFDRRTATACPYLELRFRSNESAALKLFDRLAETCDMISTAEKSLIFTFNDAPSDGWAQEPISALDALFHTCGPGWNATRASEGKANGVKATYDGLKSKQDQALVRAENKGRSMAKKAVRDPNQTQLSFAAVAGSPVQTDEMGNFVPLSSAGAPPRRSSRATASALASDSRQAAAAQQRAHKSPSPQPYAPDQVVLEYPLGEPAAVSVTYADTQRLRDEEFLNDTLIEFGLKRIMKGIEERDAHLPDGEKLAPQIHVFNSFFYKQLSTKWTNDNKPYHLVEKWTKRVNLFEKKYIVVPINEYMHWYLAIIVNPAAILKPPPPPPTPPPPASPRKSSRKRKSTANSDFVSHGSPSGSPEVVSNHFSGAGRSLRKDAEMRSEDDEETEQEEKEVRDKVQREFYAQEARHEEQDLVQAEVDRVKNQKRRRTPTPGPSAVEEMQLDSDDEAPPPHGGGPRMDAAAAGEDEDMPASLASPPPSAQPDARLLPADAMDEDDDVTLVRPEVEGGGPSKHVAASSQPQHLRFTDDNEIAVQDEALGLRSEDPSPPSPPPPARQGEPRQGRRLRRGSNKDDTPPPGTPAPVTPAITIEDEDDEDGGLPAPETLRAAAAAASALMQKGASGSSTSSSATTATATSAEPSARAAPPQATYGSSSARPRKSVVPTAFAPMDPEPRRQEELARQREEEAQRARDKGDAMDVDGASVSGEGVRGKGGTVDDCWVLTFDSLGPSHRQPSNRLKKYLGFEAQSKLGMSLDETSWAQVPHTRVDVPLQPNSCDCGLYLLHFVETFFKNPLFHLELIVAAHGRNRPTSKAKQKQAEAVASQIWAGEDAKKKRQAMRDDVRALVEDYQANIGPLREQQALEKRKRKEERRRREQQEADAEAAQRADRYEAEDLQSAEHPAPGQAPLAEQPEATAAPAAAVAEKRSSPPPPPPPETRTASPPPPAQASAARQPSPATPPRPSSKHKGGGRGKKPVEMMELSDGESSTMGSPVKSQPAPTVTSTTPTATLSPPDALAPLPPPQETPVESGRTKPKPTRKRAAYNDSGSAVASADVVHGAYDSPTRATGAPALADPEKPFSLAPSPAAAREPIDDGVLDIASPEPPRKKVKTAHRNGGGLIAAMQPAALPGGIESYGSTDEEDGDDGNAATSQELFAPPPAQALLPSMGRTARPKSSHGIETVTLPDD